MNTHTYTLYCVHMFFPFLWFIIFFIINAAWYSCSPPDLTLLPYTHTHTQSLGVCVRCKTAHRVLFILWGFSLPWTRHSVFLHYEYPFMRRLRVAASVLFRSFGAFLKHCVWQLWMRRSCFWLSQSLESGTAGIPEPHTNSRLLYLS